MRSDTTMPGPRDLGEIWVQTCERITTLLVGPPAVDPELTIPTVPGATAQHVVAYLVAQCSDESRESSTELGSAEAVRSADLTRLGFEVLVQRWTDAAGTVQPRLVADHDAACSLITAAAMCEQDLRTALDTPGARDGDAVRIALDELSGRLSDRVAQAGLPPLRVTVEQWGTIAGDGTATSCVVADRFEFVRAMSGRRSAAEIGRWNWGVEPERYLDVLAEASLPVDEIHERDPRVPAHMRDREFVL